MESIIAILVLALIALGAKTLNMSNSLGAMQRKIDELESLLWNWRDEMRGEDSGSKEKATDDQAERETAGAIPERQVASVVAKSAPDEEIASIASKEIEPPEEAEEQASISDRFAGVIQDFSLESVIGGKLPIWVGGIALAFAGFFMVRYSIEAGLFGPTARVITATLFGLLMIALSELGGRLPKIGASFSEDKRIAQSLAGAGIAVLYATLYMASELYGLIGVGTAFALVVIVTVIAFTLSLRHGPPTAIMGVVGGFMAPWIAELGPDNMPALLAYLGVFIAALFGLSIWQRWLWLLLLATGGGALWTFALVISAESGLPLLGLFITLVGGAAVFSSLRIDDSDPRFFQAALYAPLTLAMVQLAMLLPRIEFSPIGWAFVAALSVMALVLAWRDQKLLPLAGVAALIAFFPLLSGWNGAGQAGHMAAASVGYGALFGAFGHAWLVRKGKNTGWALLALLPPFLAFMAAFAWQYELEMSDGAWAFIAALVAVPVAWVAWQYRDEESARRPISILAVTITAILLGIAMLLLLPEDLTAAVFVLLAMLAAAWACFTDARAISRLSYIPLAVGILATLIGAMLVIEQMFGTLSGNIAQLDYLPSVGEIAVNTLLPALMIMAMALHPRFLTGTIGTRIALTAGTTGIGIFIWLLSRQVFAIDDAEAFKDFGFAERMLLTQPLAIGGLASLWFAQKKGNALWSKAAMTMLVIAALRFVIFDLLLFNPAIVPQALGPAPIANLAVIHCVILSTIFWTAGSWLEKDGKFAAQFAKAAKGIGLGIAIVAALVAVRQLSHGSVIAFDGIKTGENYLYSAALILLAIAWLARGIMTSASLLRVAGLALLTAVTLKVFLIDAAALEGILRILSFLGLGIALIGIGWAYGRLMRRSDTAGEAAA